MVDARHQHRRMLRKS